MASSPDVPSDRNTSPSSPHHLTPSAFNMTSCGMRPTPAAPCRSAPPPRSVIRRLRVTRPTLYRNAGCSPPRSDRTMATATMTTLPLHDAHEFTRLRGRDRFIGVRGQDADCASPPRQRPAQGRVRHGPARAVAAPQDADRVGEDGWRPGVLAGQLCFHPARLSRLKGACGEDVVSPSPARGTGVDRSRAETAILEGPTPALAGT